MRLPRQTGMKKSANISQPEPDACLFCRIARHQDDAQIVFEDEISVAFLDTRPLFPGHCLLITKGHFKTLYDLPDEIVGPLFLNAKFLAKTVQTVMKAEGTFVALNNNVSQSVPHFHIHIVPRTKGDGLRGFFWPRTKYASDADIEAIRLALASAIP